MARRHWLDPLARRLLIASGQLPPQAPAPRRRPRGWQALAAIERLASLRRRPDGGAAAEIAAAAADPIPHHEAVERDLLALRLSQNPGLRLRDAEEVRRAAALGWRLDVNRATAVDWGRLPGCTAERADLLARLRASGVQLSGPDDLAAVLDLDAVTLAGWLPLLEFRWYGDGLQPSGPRLAVNQASAADLARLPGLTAERCRRLQRERSRAPFRDLADLGQRLALPAAVLEAWIGRVSFSPGAAGPELPGAGQGSAGPAAR